MIKNVIEFVKENYQFLSVFLSIFVTLLISLFRKKVKVEDDTLGRIIRILPVFICEVEKSMTAEKCGLSKKAKVLDLALETYKHITGISVTYDSYIADQIDKAIEDILRTPQRKEIANAKINK